MHRLLCGFMVAAALFATPGLAPAEGQRRADPAPGIRRSGGAGPQFSGLFDAFDTNKDNVLDGAELSRTPEFLRKLDLNGDGKISTREVFHKVGHFRVPSPRPSAVLFGSLDTNRDSVLDSAELDRTPDVLGKFDQDGDGKIAVREIAVPREKSPRLRASA